MRVIKYDNKEKMIKTYNKVICKSLSIVRYLIFLLIILIIILPIWVVFVNSFDWYTYNLNYKLWPYNFTLNNYKHLFIVESVRNSIKISIATTIVGSIVGMLFTTMGAAVLAQKDMPGRNIMAGILLIPIFYYRDTISFYLVMRKLNLTNTLWGIILPPAINVFFIFWLKEYFETITSEITDSAKIDGCNAIQILTKIVIPISRPVILTVFLNYFIMHWNEYVSWRILITKNSLDNIQVKIRYLFSEVLYPMMCGPEGYTYEGLLYALIIVSIIPLFMLFIAFQNYFVENIVVGVEKE